MNKAIVLALALFLSAVVHAQNEFKPLTSIGLKAGANTSGIFSDPIIYLEINPGLTAGVVFQHLSQKSLGVQIELNYSQMGWKENLDTTNFYRRRLNVFQLPAMTHVRIGKGNTKAIINFGPYLSYLLSESEKIELLEGVSEQDYYRKPLSNSVELGLCFGIGVTQKTDVGLFQLETRVTYALSNSFKPDDGFSLSASNSISGELTLAYLINYESIGNLFKKKVTE